MIKSSIALAVALLGVLASYLASRALRQQVVDTFVELKTGQEWDRAAHRRMLSALLRSHVKGSDEHSYWISFVEGLSVMPAATVAGRRDSFSRAAIAIPTASDTWFPSSSRLDFWYLRFLTDIGTEAERRSEFNSAELNAWHELQRDLKAQGIESVQVKTAKWQQPLLKAAALFRRAPSLGEASTAIDKALNIQLMTGDLAQAFYTDPAYDLETASPALGSMLYSYSTETTSGFVSAIQPESKELVSATIDVTNDVRLFVINRPWLDDTLLDRYVNYGNLGGERFFGAGGHLHLVPTHIIVRSEPRYMITISSAGMQSVAGWIRASSCCTLQLHGVQRYIDPSSVILYGTLLSGNDSRLKPEVFAIVSRVR